MGNWEVDLSLIASWLKEQDQETIIGVTAVSYTHLTLPTNSRV